MIAGFWDKDTENLAAGKPVARFQAIRAAARRKLYQLHLTKNLLDLNIPPGNRLEKLGGTREGQWSIRVNDQWRICFEWRGDAAYRVEIVDYH